MVSTHLSINDKFASSHGKTATNPTSYRNLVGRLIYLTHTRPDVAFSVNTISRFMEKPSHIHFGAAK